MAKLSRKIGKRCSKSQMARFMARNSKWPENIFYGQRGANMARFEKSGHQMANLAALSSTTQLLRHAQKSYVIPETSIKIVF